MTSPAKKAALLELKELHDAGVLDDEEFNAENPRLLKHDAEGKLNPFPLTRRVQQFVTSRGDR